jgi:hypothetical protein
VQEIHNRVRQHTARDVMDYITVNGGRINGSRDLLQFTTSFFKSCYTLDFTNHSLPKNDGIGSLILAFHDMKNFSVVIEVEGATLSSNRIIRTNAFFSSGDAIKMENGKGRTYAVQIKKNVYMEEDLSKNCKNYPTPEFRSYNDCVDQKINDTLSCALPGLVPIWLTDDPSKVTTNILSTDPAVGNMFSGLRKSNCPLPCTTFHIETKFTTEFADYFNGIEIEIFQKVQVVTTDFVTPPISSFLSVVGGSMGLWLGLGVLQVVEMIVNLILRT